MRTFKIVLDIEVGETKVINQQIIEASFRNYQKFMADPEQVEYLGYEQALLNLVLTNSEAYKKYITASIVSRLEGMDWRNMFTLAGIERQDFETLADLIPELPPAAKAHYEEALRDEWLGNATDLIVECFNQYRLTSIKVEGDFTPPGLNEV
jgi:hypothetical protein